MTYWLAVGEDFEAGLSSTEDYEYLFFVQIAGPISLGVVVLRCPKRELFCLACPTND